MILIIQLNVSHNEVMVMRLVQRNETITTLTVMMGEIVTEHQLRIVGYEVVDLRLQLILEKDETMDIIKTTTQILSSESRYVEMDTKLMQRSEMMATLTMEMGDHLNEKLKTKILLDQSMSQQQLLQLLKLSLQQVFVLVHHFPC